MSWMAARLSLCLPKKSETDSWLLPEPGVLAQTYGETKSGPAISALTQMMRGYATGDAFNFSSNARQLRDNLRALSPAIYPTESQLRIEYFYNHFDGFYRAAWCYGIALLILIVAHAPETRRLVTQYGCRNCRDRSSISRECDRDALPDCRATARDKHVRIHHLGFVRRFIFRHDLFCAVSRACLFARRIAGDIDRTLARPSNADRDAFEHRSAGAGLRDNFWLTIHVLTITLSYAAFALAMGFGHILLFRYARNPAEARADQPMHFWLYRVLQLGVLCSPPEQFSAVSGRIIPGDDFGAGIRRKRGRLSHCFATSRHCTEGSPVGGHNLVWSSRVSSVFSPCSWPGMA